jgi:hypothetical protein
MTSILGDYRIARPLIYGTPHFPNRQKDRPRPNRFLLGSSLEDIALSKKKKKIEINIRIVCEQYDIKPSRIGFANLRNFNLHFTMAQPIQLTAPNKTSYLQPTGG